MAHIFIVFSAYVFIKPMVTRNVKIRVLGVVSPRVQMEKSMATRDVWARVLGVASPLVKMKRVASPLAGSLKSRFQSRRNYLPIV